MQPALLVDVQAEALPPPPALWQPPRKRPRSRRPRDALDVDSPSRSSEQQELPAHIRASLGSEEMLEEAPCPKRPRLPAYLVPPGPALAAGLALHVRWHLAGSEVVCHRLKLAPAQPLATGKGFGSRLLDKVFGAVLPPHVLSRDYLHFAPTQDFLPSQGRLLRTEFRLSLPCGGREVAFTHRELPSKGRDSNVFVTAIEFQSLSLKSGCTGVRIPLVAYPLVSVRRSFLEYCSRLLQVRQLDSADSADTCESA